MTTTRELENMEKTKENDGHTTLFSISLDKLRKKLIAIDPAVCKPWKYHNRDVAWLTAEKCSDLINSIQKHGQHQPVLVRALSDDSDYEYEIIYGVRRWFACSNIQHQKLWAYVTDIDDKTSTILMHTENANSKDITEFERAFSFAQQLKHKIFKNQTDMAEALGLSQGTISRMIRSTEIFDYDWLQKLFINKSDIPIKHAYNLSIYLKKEEALEIIKEEAYNIHVENQTTRTPMSSSNILKRILNKINYNYPNPLKNVILMKENRPIVFCERDRLGKIHIIFDKEAKTLDRNTLKEAFETAMNDFVFENLFPGE